MIAGLLAAFMSTFSGTINAAAAYLVNDVYKRYLRPDAQPSVSTSAPAMWLDRGGHRRLRGRLLHRRRSTRRPNGSSPALWGGYAAPNVLKWHWWRFNGWGYFWGMMAGIAGALALLSSAGESIRSRRFPVLLLFSPVRLGGRQPAHAGRSRSRCSLNFYTRTRPWGWWGPIRAAAIRRDPAFEPNRDFARDAFNVMVGIVWQTAFVALPIYVVIQHWRPGGISLAIIVVTSTILKHTWYDRLEAA